MWQSIPDGLGVRIPGFHPGGPGSIPGLGEFFKMCIKNSPKQSIRWHYSILSGDSILCIRFQPIQYPHRPRAPPRDQPMPSSRSCLKIWDWNFLSKWAVNICLVLQIIPGRNFLYRINFSPKLSSGSLATPCMSIFIFTMYGSKFSYSFVRNLGHINFIFEHHRIGSHGDEN